MSGGVGVNIFSHFHPEGVLKAIAEFKKLDTASQKAQFGIKKAAIPAAAALAGLAAAATHALHAAMENEVSQMRFDKVLRNVTGASIEQMEAINKNVEAMAHQTGMTQEQLRPALQYLVVATGSVTTAQKDMKIAMDISAATGADLETVTAALGKAHNGVTKGLVKLDPSLKKVLGSTKDFAVIQDILIQKFGGSEAAFEKTAAGGMRRFQEGMHELWITIGNALLPVMQELIPYLQSFAEWAKNNAGKMVFIAKGIALVSVAIIALNTYLKITAALETLVMLLNPFTAMYIALLALGAAFLYGINEMYGLKNAFNAVGNFFIGLIEFLINTFDNWIISLVDDWNWALDKLHLGFMKIGTDWEKTFGNIHIPRFGEETKKEVDGSDRHLSTMAESAAQQTGKVITAFDKVGGAVKKVVNKFAEFTDKLRGASDAHKKVADEAQKVVDAQQKVSDALNKSSQAFNAIGKAQHDVEKAQRDVTKAYLDVDKAIANVTKAHHDVQKSMVSAANATLDVDKAQKKLVKTTTDLTTAQKAFDDAVHGFSANSKEGLSAQEQMNEAQRKAEHSGYAAETAAFSVTKAEQDLAAARIDGTLTAQDIREKEIALAEAKLSLIEAQKDQINSQNDVTTASDEYNQTLNGVTKDSATYKDLLQQLTDAKDAQTEASKAVTDAQTAEAEATLAIQDALVAEEEAQRSVEDAKYAVSEAILAVADAQEAERQAVLDYEAAKRDEAAAVTDVANAKYDEANAILEMAKAEAELNAQRKKTPAAIVGQATTAFNAAMAQAGSAFGGKVPETIGATFATSLQDMLDFSGMPRMASGGVVTRPTIAMIGESGAEAIVPLSQMNGMGGSINITVNAGMGVNGAELGQQIIDEIRKAERRSGRVFASA